MVCLLLEWISRLSCRILDRSLAVQVSNIVARFVETERYDIQLDCDVVQFTAVTDKGSFHCEVPIEGPRSLRRKRELFKERAAEYMMAGANPCYIDLDEYDG